MKAASQNHRVTRQSLFIIILILRPFFYREIIYILSIVLNLQPMKLPPGPGSGSARWRGRSAFKLRGSVRASAAEHVNRLCMCVFVFL